MDAKQLLIKLSQQGISLYVQEQKLKSRAAPGAITPQIAELIKSHKAALIELLATSREQASTLEIPEFDRQAPICLSYAQQRVWFIDALEGATPQYNIPSALFLKGDLNLSALQGAVDIIVERHEVLRSRYIEVQGGGRQIIDPPRSVELTIEDMASSDESQLQERVDNEISKPFTLSQDLMMRVVLLKKSSKEYILLFTLHHIAADGWSLGLIVKEFSELYRSLSQHLTPTLPELSIQYADYAVWQRQGNGKKSYDAQLNYWLEKLADLPELHGLATDYPRPQTQDFDGGLVQSTVSKVTTESLNAIAKNHNVTLFMVLQSAFSLLLSRFSGSDDIVMGTPTAGRHHKALETMVGFFVNNLVLRHKIDHSVCFSEFLKQAASTLIEGFSNQDIPFDKLVDELQPERAMSHTPLFQIMFSLQNFSKSTLDLPGLSVSSVSSDQVTAKFDLELSIVESEAGLTISWTYASSLFTEQTIQRLADSFNTLLYSICENDEQPISQLRINTDDEVRALLSWGKGPNLEPEPSSCLAEYFYQVAASHPERTAAIENDTHISFEALRRESAQLATLLINSGVQPNDYVGLCCNRSIDMLRGMLAILQVGAAYVPLDINYPESRLDYMVNDSGMKHVLIQSSLVTAFPVRGLCEIKLDERQNWESLNEIAQPVFKAPGDVACIVYTSGTTGEPKGVLHRHQGIQRMLNAPEMAQLSAPPRLLHLASISFDAAHFEIWVTLLNGGSLVMYCSDYLDIDDLNVLCIKHDINMLFLTSSLFDQWCLHCQSLSQIEAVFSGGEAMTPASVGRFYEALPDAKLFNLYGPTESTTYVTAYAVPPAAAQLPNVPLGHVVAGTQLFVLDGNHQLAPWGAVGELCVAGQGLAAGYLNKADITAKAFVSMPQLCDGPVYLTGDQVRINQYGELDYFGRKDFQVKIRGYRVELGAIEAEILKCSKIQKAKVLAIGAKGQKALVAFIEVEQAQAFSVTTLQQQLSVGLPAYMLPDHYQIIASFPTTANGKVNTDKLLTEFRPDEANEYVPAEGDIEEALHSIWCEVLEVERVDVTKPFFSVGGNSINLLSLRYKLNDMGCDVSLKQLMEQQTIRAQAELLNSAQSENDQQLECIVNLNNHQDDVPLFIMHPFGGGVEGYRDIANMLEPYCPVFGIQAPFMYGDKSPHGSLNELAEYYSQAINKYWSGKEVMLSGYSGGGQLAAIVSEQLNNIGKKVNYIALFDTYFEDPDKQPNETAFNRMCRFMYSKSLIDSFDEVPEQWKCLTYEMMLSQFSEFVVERTHGKIRLDDAVLALDFSNDLLKADMLPFKNAISVPACDYFLSTSNLLREQNITRWQSVFANSINVVDVPFSHDIFMEPQSLKVMLPHLIKACENNKKGEK